MGFNTIFVVMGVSGSGKTTVAAMLARALGVGFLEGDEMHPGSNVEKMKRGTPLTDADRLPWLQAIARRIDEWRTRGEAGVVTCSALKRAYRDILIGDRPEVRLVYLRGSRDVMASHLARRSGHFMPASLLQSQIDTLEEPGPDEDPLIVDVGPPASDVADQIIRRLSRDSGKSIDARDDHP